MVVWSLGVLLLTSQLAFSLGHIASRLVMRTGRDESIRSCILSFFCCWRGKTRFINQQITVTKNRLQRIIAANSQSGVSSVMFVDTQRCIKATERTLTVKSLWPNRLDTDEFPDLLTLVEINNIRCKNL